MKYVYINQIIKHCILLLSIDILSPLQFVSKKNNEIPTAQHKAAKMHKCGKTRAIKLRGELGLNPNLGGGTLW